MKIAIRKFYYGDIPEEAGGSNQIKSTTVSTTLEGGLATLGSFYPQQTRA